MEKETKGEESSEQLPLPETEMTPAQAAENGLRDQRAMLMCRVEQNRDAYLYGEKAKRNGWYRISPFYGDSFSDDFFYAGFDGVPWERALCGEFQA